MQWRRYIHFSYSNYLGPSGHLFYYLAFSMQIPFYRIHPLPFSVFRNPSYYHFKTPRWLKMIIRWVSEDGKRKWMYPVKRDLHTKGKIIKQVSRRAKIIGITKVNIPSPLHPIVPYNILLLEDEFGNRMPKKTMKERKIGETYEIKPAKTGGAVVITKIKYDTEEYLKESLKLLHDYKINSDDKILIKPSIIE